jgi:hypothetical protein
MSCRSAANRFVYISGSGAGFPRSLGIVMLAKAGNQYLELD